MVVDYLSSQPNWAGYQVSTKQGSGPGPSPRRIKRRHHSKQPQGQETKNTPTVEKNDDCITQPQSGLPCCRQGRRRGFVMLVNMGRIQIYIASVPVDDVARAHDFYVNTLGFRVKD